VENKYKIGITGSNGFVGKHLKNHLELYPEKYEIIPFERSYFEEDLHLDLFTSSCDVIIHLAAVNRSDDEAYLYNVNVSLAMKLSESLKRTSSKARIIFSSSSQEHNNSIYGNAKRKAREILENSALDRNVAFLGLIIPNAFGPFSKPNYNTFIATFCHNLINNIEPKVITDSLVSLIYIDSLVEKIISNFQFTKVETITFEPEINILVSDVLSKLMVFKNEYLDLGQIPKLTNKFDLNLFNTFRSYIDHKSFFPFQLSKKQDERGMFVEVLKLGVGGQVSFSTTKSGITRGNHFHMRKIERFSVVKGSAKIEMRHINEKEKLTFTVNDYDPSFVDMPIWYTHNITNVGSEELITFFWINEFFDTNNPDTYQLNV
jgi:UDP-2-acetamido-2,6-beta-L-arabino-hexul-4-ose reductase